MGLEQVHVDAFCNGTFQGKRGNASFHNFTTSLQKPVVLSILPPECTKMHPAFTTKWPSTFTTETENINYKVLFF